LLKNQFGFGNHSHWNLEIAPLFPFSFSLAQGVYAWDEVASGLAPFMGLLAALRRAPIGSSQLHKPLEGGSMIRP
jgi:hypothetical protein